MGVYSPYFNSMTSWYPNGWLYKDSYALYTDESVASQHPEWVLRDGAGNPLYIQWGCSKGTCPQYAADISSQAYRQWWISQAKAELSAGYRGLFVDDVNMEMRVSNGHEEAVAPIDPSTGQPMTATAWRSYMAQFMNEIRAALPGVEIVHNAIWFSDEDAGSGDASIRSEISASDYIYLERGANDSGLTGGDGRWSLNALLSFVDQVHSLGKGVVLDGSASSVQGMEYNLSNYFLISTGNDAVSAAGQTPGNWWAGWNVDLGEAAGPRYSWNGLLRRDFTGGTVLVNPPGSPTQTVSLSSPMQDVDGNTITSVILPAASGAILRDISSTSSTPELTAPPPTESIMETTSIGNPTAPLSSEGGSSNSKSASGGSTSASGTETALSTPQPTPLQRKRSHHKRSWRALRARAARTRHTRRHARLARHHVALTRVRGSVA